MLHFLKFIRFFSYETKNKKEEFINNSKVMGCTNQIDHFLKKKTRELTWITDFLKKK